MLFPKRNQDMSSLAYLDRAAADAVERQSADPGAFIKDDPRARKRIKGIEVIDAGAIDQRRVQLDLYRDDSADLRKRLDEHGVAVLAMLPKTAWDAIARDAGLFRFSPKDDGSVPANAALLDQVGANALRTLGNRALIGLGIGAAAAFIAAFALLSMIGAPLALNLGVSAALAALGAYGTGTVIARRTFLKGVPHPDALMRLEQSLIRKAFAAPRQELFRELWPQDPKPGTTTVDLRIGMPPAPAEAQANLVRAEQAGFDLTLYAVDEAVTFLDDPVEAFIQARAPHWRKARAAYDRVVQSERHRRRAERERRRAELRAWLADPIVTIDHGSVTAIVVQYGGFPLEEAAIDRVLNSDRLI